MTNKEMLQLLDILLECTFISKKRVKAYNPKREKEGTTLDYKINSTHVTKKEYHLVRKAMIEKGYY